MLECLAALGARRVVLTHIEEPDQLSYDDLLQLEQREDLRALRVTFAYDGLVVEVPAPANLETGMSKRTPKLRDP